MQSAAKPQRESRTAAFEALTAGVKAELTEDRFAAAIGKFREAVNLSRGLSDLEEAAVRLGIETATALLPRGSRIAESVLLEAADVDSKKLIPADLWKRIQEHERDEAVRSALLAADAVTTKAMVPPVRQRLARLADRYPDEVSLRTRLQALDALAALETAGENHRRPPVNWSRVRNAATAAFTVLSLASAGGLIWMNRSKFTPGPQVAVVKRVSADDAAWSAVNPNDMDLVEGYLERFPNGANRGLAVRALSEIRIQRRQWAEVRDVLQQYEAAWNARNVDGILSLRQDLDRSALQERLLPVKRIVMNLSPASNPRIQGDQATVRCLRTVSEVDEDGAAKRSPEEAVTFVLARRDGGWIIQSASQP